MNAESQPRSDGLRESLDALTDRIDTLSSLVREATGEIAANDVGQSPDQIAADLGALRSELDALRGFVADRPNQPRPIAAAASDPLRETIAELAGRIDALAEVVHSAIEGMVGEHGLTSELARTLAEQDARAQARYVEIQQRLDAGSRHADTGLAGSEGVMQRLDELTTRLDELYAIVAAQQSGALDIPGQAQPPLAAPAVETSGILSRLAEADRLRAETREKVLAQMEKIATRMDWRLQRLEEAGAKVAAGVDES